MKKTTCIKCGYVGTKMFEKHNCELQIRKTKEVKKDINKLIKQVGKDISENKKQVLDWAYTEEKVELKHGVKYDEGKTQWALLPSEALEEVAKVYTFGAKKYAPNNWRKGISWSRTFSAIMRHSWSFWRGETNDPETGLHHLAHAAFGCLTLIEYTKKKIPQDDRVK